MHLAPMEEKYFPCSEKCFSTENSSLERTEPKASPLGRMVSWNTHLFLRRGFPGYHLAPSAEHQIFGTNLSLKQQHN